MTRLQLLCAAVGALVIAQRAAAQTPQGTISDSASRQPIAGAVVSLIDSTGNTIARLITGPRGAYRFPGFTTARRLRVVRMGFRPRDIALPRPLSDEPVDVRMLAIPMMLDQVSTIANSMCPRRSDRAAAFALLEQARAGLLNVMVARKEHPASMTILAYERFFDGVSDSIVRQSVRMRGGEKVLTSFFAVRSAAEFVRDGFVVDSGNTRLYYGPDVDVLLDAGFSAGYCFHLRNADRNRPTQAGLAFVPARRRQGRIDLDGTLWIDTAAKRLVSLEYRYLGLPIATDPVEPGGFSSFWENENGIAFIDKWRFNVPVPQTDTSVDHRGDLKLRTWYARKEPGGELADATWPDGHSFMASLGTLNARVVDARGQPLTGVAIRLTGTDYLASPDSFARLEMTNLLPGPYIAVALHPELEQFRITLPTSLRFTAYRDSVVQATIVVPDPFQHVRRPCGHYDDPLIVNDQAPQMPIFVQTSDKKPIHDAWWRISKSVGEPWQKITEVGRTREGRVMSCMSFMPGDLLELAAWRDGEEPSIHRYRFEGGKGRTFTITLPFVTPP